MDKTADVAPVTKVPAIGYSITANLDDRRQIVVQCFVDEDADDGTVKAKLDRALSFVDRAVARYSIKKLRDELAQHEVATKNGRENLDKLNQEFEHAQAAREVEIAAMSEKIDDEIRHAKAKFEQSGRRGDFHLNGAPEANVRNMRVSMEQVKTAMAKAKSEKEQAEQQFTKSMERFHEESERRKKEIAELEGLLG